MEPVHRRHARRRLRLPACPAYRARHSGTSAQVATVLSLFQASESGYARRFSRVLSGERAAGVRAAGGTIALSQSLRVFDRDGNERTPGYDDGAWSTLDILHLDEAMLVLSVSFTGAQLGQGVVLLRTSGLTELARYSTADANLAATSFAVVGNHYVVGSPAELTVLAPYCP